MSVNRCVCCNIPIAEDRQVCNMCENGWKTNTNKAFDIQTGYEIYKPDELTELQRKKLMQCDICDSLHWHKNCTGCKWL